MKKVIAVLLAAVLSLALVACSAPNVRGSVTNVPETTTAAPTAAPTVAPTAAPIETPAAEDSAFAPGTTEGGTYTNTFLKLGCTLDSNWTFYTEDQLMQISGLVSDVVNDEELSKYLADSVDSGKLIYDMYAANANGTTTINVVIENMGVLYGAALDEEGYVDLALKTLEQEMSSAGMTNIVTEKVTVDFAGASHAAITTSATYGGRTMYDTIVTVKQGNYIGAITFASFGENTTTDMLSLFYAA